jgi:hypothetical protein
VILVMVFLILLTSTLGLTYRQIASVLRIEAARARQVLGSEQSLKAAATALADLEQNATPTYYRLYSPASGGPTNYQVTVTAEPTLGADGWTVQVVPAPVSP